MENNLKQEIEKLKKQNNDLKKIYLDTSKKLSENGDLDLSGYFLAQIDACPTFFVEPVIDYYKECKKLEEENFELKKLVKAKDDIIEIKTERIQSLLKRLEKK